MTLDDLTTKIINSKELHLKKLDILTLEMITTLNQFHELDLDTLARDKWLNYYQKAREHYNTLRVHQIDEQAYEYANRQLKQYYNSIINKED